MIRLKESHFKPVQDDLTAYFYQWYYKPILDLIQEKRYNSIYNANSALVAAIRKGSIVYINGVFSGKFNSRTSRELSKFAKYDKRSKTWKGRPPSDVLAASIVANDKAKELNERIKSLLPQLDSNVKNVVKQLHLNIEPTIDSIDKQLVLDVKGLTVLPEITESMREAIANNYTDNMILNIVNENGPGDWNSEQITRLRDMVEKITLRGSNRNELLEMIQAEFEVSKNKARFLARQETSLFLVEMRDTRYIGAGLEFYEWLTSNDSRVVGNPAGKYPDPSKGHGNHFMMNHKICKFKDPTVYADTIEDAKKGKWKSKASIQGGNKHPGQEFLCRCVSKPLII
jgi:hypothetical protein